MPHLLFTSLISASLLVSVHSVPVSTPLDSQSTPPPSATAPAATSATPTAGYILLDWDRTTPTSTAYSDSPSDPAVEYISSILLHPAAAIETPLPSKTKASWALPPTFSNMDPFSITSYAAGEQNIAVLRGSPVKWSNGTTGDALTGGPGGSEKWEMGQNALQISYPKGSINPGHKPQGGAEFYGQPLDLRQATNTSLQYSVYFPHDFDFVKGGKLPGLYGGHKGCSGGNAAEDCFSTRVMWRAGGKGELYLYVPKDKQSASLCSTPPKSVCDSEYGLSIGRGAWTFPLGDWTTIRQDIWLNTPGLNDGGFNIWINGNLVKSANDVRYRENAAACTNTISAAAVPENNEDWSSLSAEDVDIASSSISSAPATATISSASASRGISSSTSDPLPPSSALTSMSSRTPRPTFQTPMRRWFEERDDLDPELMDDSSDSSAADLSPLADTSRTPPNSRVSSSTASPASSPSDIPNDTQDTSPDDDTTDALTNSTGTASSPVSEDLGMDNSPMDPSSTPSASASTLQSSTDDSVTGASADVSNCGVGFIGLFFSTFFGGHTPEWASPKDQYTYYKDFAMWVTE